MSNCSIVYKDQPRENYNFPLEKFYCPDSKDAALQGYWGAKNYKSLRVKVEKCKNSTKIEKDCFPQAEIDSFIQNGFL